MAKNVPGGGSGQAEAVQAAVRKEVWEPPSHAQPHQSHSWQAVMTWAWLIKHI